MLTSPHHRPERGATAILVAISLLLLMGMAALAVDVGAAFDDRRQQQSAVDAGSLAAVQYANLNDPAPLGQCLQGTLLERAACRGAIEAMDVVGGGLSSAGVARFDAAEWSTCTDPDDAAYPQGSGPLASLGIQLSDCISFTANLKKARVVLPTTQVSTSFGRVIGVNSIDISSTAEAVVDLNSSGDVIPFALGPTGAGSSQACIFANPTDVLDVEPCNGPTEGNFGFLDISLYGNDDPLVGTTTKCTGDTQGRLATNIIVGADHEHGKYTLGDTIRNDTTMCPISTALPNEVPTQTGGSATGLDNGLFRGISSPLGEGRLMCKGSLSSSTSGEGQRFPRESESCVDILNNLPEELDNTPLWEFLNEDAASDTAACAKGLVNSRQTMAACLLAWRAAATHSTYLFEDEVLASTRFAGVPKLSANPSNGTGNYLILDVIPVYLETLYMGCTANSCALVHSPGETGPASCPSPLTPLVNTCGVPANGNPNLRALTSFILTMDMLTPELAERWPTRPGTLQFNLLK